MAYTLGNKCAKKCCKPTILVQLIVENVVIFWDTVYMPYMNMHVFVDGRIQWTLCWLWPILDLLKYWQVMLI